jgi:hypothetical protein
VRRMWRGMRCGEGEGTSHAPVGLNRLRVRHLRKQRRRQWCGPVRTLTRGDGGRETDDGRLVPRPGVISLHPPQDEGEIQTLAIVRRLGRGHSGRGC